VSERLEIVQLNAANEVEVLLNLNDEVSFFPKAESFKVIPGVKQQVIAEDQRRWGGGRQVAETTELGAIEWVTAVAGTSEQACLEKVEILLAQLEGNPYRAYVLWQPPGASHPTLYEMRGTGVWTPEYEERQYSGATFIPFLVHIPVAPLALGLPVKVYEKGGLTLPAVLSLEAIPGDAPALTEVTVETGTEPTTILSGLAAVQGVAIDGTYVYYADGKAIGRAKLTGAEPNNAFLPLTAEPYYIAVNASHIYWSNPAGNTIGRATISGGTVEESFITGASAPSGIALDSTYVYYGNSGTATIGRATLAGGSVNQSFITGAGSPLGVAVNASNVFWANSAVDAIGRAVIAGGAGEGAWLALSTGVFPEGMAVLGQFVYWSSVVTQAIGRVSLTGTEESPLYITGARSPVSLAVSSTFAYWSNQETGTVSRVALSEPSIWALLGWAAAPASGLAPAPFGLLSASASTAVGSGWSSYGTVTGALNGKARHGTGTRAGAYWEVDPATMVPDSFRGEIAVEVWARILSKALVGPVNLTLSAQPQDGAAYGAPRYTDEWGSGGRPFVPAVGEGSAWPWRLTRLGTLHLLVNPLAPRIWKLWLEGTCASVGEWGVDYLLVVPVLQRACSPSSKEDTAAYPRFIANIGPTVKTVKSNLSALIAKPGKNGHPDSGLGGQLMTLPAGSTQLLVKLSSGVPDSPAVSAAVEQASYSAAVTVTVTPRFFLARTA
jgi:virginiamycin B lyase